MTSSTSHSKGYPISIFQDATFPVIKYLCSICALVLNNPVQRFCGHRYCRVCIDEENAAATGSETVCPACSGDDVDEEMLEGSTNQIFTDNAIRREMSSLPTVCCDPQCTWTGIFKDFVDHYEEHHRVDETSHCPFGCGLALNSETDLNDHAVERLVEHLDAAFNRMRALEDIIGASDSGRAESILPRLADSERKLLSLQSQLESQRTVTEQNIASAAAAAGGGASSSSSTSSSSAAAAAAAARPASDAATSTLSAEKMIVIEGVITVLNRELEKMTLDMESLERKRTMERESLDSMDRKVRTMERMMAVKDATINELTIRLVAVEQTSYDGILLWRVSEVQKKRQDAAAGRTTSIYSPPFFTSRTGYKMCLRIYLNGDGMGKGSHLSVFFVVMRGHYDALLSWPFRQKVSLMLLSQNQRQHIVDAFRPDPTSSSFKRPTTEMNIASGCPLFAALDVIDIPSNGYVRDDQFFLKATVDCSELS